MLSVLALASGLWLWPSPSLSGPPGWPIRWRALPTAVPGYRPTFLVALVLGAGAALLSGPAVGLAAVLLTSTVGWLVIGELLGRRARLELETLLLTLRTLAREVRAGATPLAAIAATASAHGGAGRAALESLSGIVALTRAARPAGSGNIRAPDRRDVVAGTVDRLAVGWALSERHGVPWAALIDASVADLADRVRGDAARTAQVSGPRVSGYVLAVLPALGLVLGAGMGADPVHVLLHTAVGNLLMLAGSGLTCAGLIWTARIVRT